MISKNIQFAFFWVGNNINIPTMLVNSIRRIYNSEAYIFHLTDNLTDAIYSVNETLRFELPHSLMTARVKAYSMLKSKSPVIFLDADSLLIDRISLPNFDNFTAFLIKRNPTQEILNHNYPEYYPEFEGKFLIDTMPILFGFIATKNGGEFFVRILNVLELLPERFHRWYGDQIALAKVWGSNKNEFLLLDNNKYLFVTKNSLSTIQIKNLIKAKNCKVITFKGKKSKVFIQETLESIKNI